MGQTLNTFLAWKTHLVQLFSEKCFSFLLRLLLLKYDSLQIRCLMSLTYVY